MHKYVKVKQHIPEQPMGQKKEAKKYFYKKKVETQLTKTSKAVLRWKFTAINAHIKKNERHHGGINPSSFLSF